MVIENGLIIEISGLVLGKPCEIKANKWFIENGEIENGLINAYQ